MNNKGTEISENSFSSHEQPIELSNFVKNNSHAKLNNENGTLYIETPWGADDCRIKIGIDDNKLISALSFLVLPIEFDAIIHLDTNSIEFVYHFLSVDSDQELLDRKIEISFDGVTYLCETKEPTDRLFHIARSVERLHLDGRISIPQILPFKDYSRLEDLTERQKKYFAKRVPRSFFITPEKDISQIDLVHLSKNINFILRYYDRSSAQIVIKFQDTSESNIVEPLRYVDGKFPKKLLLRPIDDIILKLLEVAERSSPRHSFIYCYQIIEYAGHYYLDKDAKNRIRKLLCDPAILDADEDKFSRFFTALIELRQEDDAKMRKVVEELCDPLNLWNEICNNKEFFSMTQIFEGGFSIPPLVSSSTDFESWKTMWTPKLFDSFTKTRNALVHVREKREIKVILPTRKNDLLLSQYVPIIRRVSEQIALMMENK